MTGEEGEKERGREAEQLGCLRGKMVKGEMEGVMLKDELGLICWTSNFSRGRRRGREKTS